MKKGPYLTYFFGTEKEIHDYYQNEIRDVPKEKYIWGSVSQLAGAYLFWGIFPLTSLYFAADGVVRLVNEYKGREPSGLVGLIRDKITQSKSHQRTS